MAGNKYLKNNGGVITEQASSQTSAGAGDAGKIPALDSDGVLDHSIINAVTSSAGAGDADKIPALDGTGKLDLSFLPSGVGPSVATINCTENLAAGDFVDVYTSSGVKCRKADTSAAGKTADGFVLAGFTSGNPATVYFAGSMNDQLSSLTAGTTYYVDPSTPGGVTATVPTTAGQVIQQIGVAVSTTAIAVEFGMPIVLA